MRFEQVQYGLYGYRHKDRFLELAVNVTGGMSPNGDPDDTDPNRPYLHRLPEL